MRQELSSGSETPSFEKRVAQVLGSLIILLLWVPVVAVVGTLVGFLAFIIFPWLLSR